jgi:SAM-dependent methyltransferase
MAPPQSTAEKTLAFDENHWWIRGMRSILWPWLDHVLIRFHAPRIAEIAEGGGGLASHIGQRYGHPVVVAGFDPKRGLAAASNSLDLLLSLDGVGQLERGKEDLAFQEFCRVLKPGGVVFVRVAALDELHSKHSEFMSERQRFSKQRLRGALERAGFSIERIGYFNTLLLPAAWLKFRLWEPLTNAPAANALEVPLPGLLNALLSAPLWVESLVSRIGWTFPLGQTLLCAAVKSFDLDAGKPKYFRPSNEGPPTGA